MLKSAHVCVMRGCFISVQTLSVSSNPTTVIHTPGDTCQQVPNECPSDPPALQNLPLRSSPGPNM